MLSGIAMGPVPPLLLLLHVAECAPERLGPIPMLPPKTEPADDNNWPELSAAAASYSALPFSLSSYNQPQETVRSEYLNPDYVLNFNEQQADERVEPPAAAIGVSKRGQQLGSLLAAQGGHDGMILRMLRSTDLHFTIDKLAKYLRSVTREKEAGKRAKLSMLSRKKDLAPLVLPPQGHDGMILRMLKRSVNPPLPLSPPHNNQPSKQFAERQIRGLKTLFAPEGHDGIILRMLKKRATADDLEEEEQQPITSEVVELP